MVICLERGADLHMVQLMPLPLTVSCFSKIQIGFTFLVPAHLGSPGQRAAKCVCVCVHRLYVGLIMTVTKKSLYNSCTATVYGDVASANVTLQYCKHLVYSLHQFRPTRNYVPCIRTYVLHIDYTARFC